MATPATEIAVAGSPGLPAGARASEELLHDAGVPPAAVDRALLPVPPDRAEAERFVEPEPRRVPGQGGEHQLVIAVPAGELDEPGQELAADAVTAPAALDVDREVGDEAVAGAWAERVEAPPADDLAALLGHDDRMARLAAGQPLPAFLGGPELGLQRGGAVLDALVVDAADRAGVVGRRRADGEVHGQTPSSRASSRPSVRSRANSSSVRRVPSASDVRGRGPKSRWYRASSSASANGVGTSSCRTRPWAPGQSVWSRRTKSAIATASPWRLYTRAPSSAAPAAGRRAVATSSTKIRSVRPPYGIRKGRPSTAAFIASVGAAVTPRSRPGP